MARSTAAVGSRLSMDMSRLNELHLLAEMALGSLLLTGAGIHERRNMSGGTK